MSVTRAEGDQPPHPSAPGDVEVLVAHHLASVDVKPANVTVRALALFGDAAAAQERLRPDVVRLVLLAALATAALTTGLSLATLVLILRT